MYSSLQKYNKLYIVASCWTVIDSEQTVKDMKFRLWLLGRIRDVRNALLMVTGLFKEVTWYTKGAVGKERNDGI